MLPNPECGSECRSTLTWRIYLLAKLLSLIIEKWVKNPTSDPDSSFEVLSSHTAIARFVGVKFHPCLHMTSLCPDRCGHAKYLASFNIEEYEKYEKKGEYGDEKQTVFSFDMNPKAKVDRQAEAVIERVKTLKEGDLVRLSWDHIYVTSGGSKYPERIVRTLETI
ncbi:putative flp protein [Blattamonas nauphoetae]|uniref:Flp protein n=1 Tax=Blattamonas nauphoetae TaxID=2049346 RepID=A0ABQ9YAA3_9EUKA|nr:putative flp protein [Blattamonas nauphoetae]